ncbi:PAS domain S-box protein [Spirochaeta africana]|uniref:PAS domain S-box n=1 Tax=Spirochaeta africana (strain ATCC 700263 / DSM 8902 / Z-7692) TaxID=889378 RepID=H9UHD8_SPIAZ|nr:PAS domain S-box protein [Spirochaeta africana]AFG36931.1 PAS domain S-box [Spirochaeta africana DSM 8902]
MAKNDSRLLQSPIIGYARHQILCDDTGLPSDYRFLEVNTTFEHITGLKADEILGNTVRQVLPGIERSAFNWIERYGKIALQGGEEEFEQYSEMLKRWSGYMSIHPIRRSLSPCLSI